MIRRIGIDNTGRQNNNVRKNNGREQNPNFKGLGAIALSGIQACERMPMVNVAVIDMLSAILPRTIVESMTNWFAGFEAFRRESSGLIVNCLIPSVIAYGFAKLFNKHIMPSGSNLSKCWADSTLVDKVSEYYKQTSSADKSKETLKKMISNVQGIEGKKVIKLGEVLSEQEIEEYAQKLADYSREEKPKTDFMTRIKNLFKSKKNKKLDAVQEVSNSIIQKTRIAENIKVIDGAKEVKASSINTLLSDSVKYLGEYEKVKGKVSIDNFAKQGKKLIKAKSLAGLSVILPLAISMQYINRWITGKLSGVKGAPIYDDFAKGEKSLEQENKSKEGLFRQKVISIASMLGVSLLSMMKRPSMNMLEFKGMFPTMDQARIISTATFASRMAAADDTNELAEATVRDIATFSSLYFLGDYASKGAASIIQKSTGISLLNDTKPIDKNANVFKKLWHWVKDVNVKSSDEVVSKTEEALKAKGLKPTAEQMKTINKELKHATNLRSCCQVANLGVSLALLGIIIPIFTRSNTKKKHEAALKLAQQNQTQTQDENKKESVTPLNIEYSKLTAGFRSEKH